MRFHHVDLCSWDMIQLWLKFTVCNAHAMLLGAASVFCWPLLRWPHLPVEYTLSSRFLPQPAVLPSPSHSWGDVFSAHNLCNSGHSQVLFSSPGLASGIQTRIFQPGSIGIYGSIGVQGWWQDVCVHFSEKKVCRFYQTFKVVPSAPLLSSQLMFSECLPCAWHCCKYFAWIVAHHYCSGLLRWDVLTSPISVCKNWNNSEVGK